MIIRFCGWPNIKSNVRLCFLKLKIHTNVLLFGFLKFPWKIGDFIRNFRILLLAMLLKLLRFNDIVAPVFAICGNVVLLYLILTTDKINMKRISIVLIPNCILDILLALLIFSMAPVNPFWRIAGWPSLESNVRLCFLKLKIHKNVFYFGLKITYFYLKKFVNKN